MSRIFCPLLHTKNKNTVLLFQTNLISEIWNSATNMINSNMINSWWIPAFRFELLSPHVFHHNFSNSTRNCLAHEYHHECHWKSAYASGVLWWCKIIWKCVLNIPRGDLSTSWNFRMRFTQFKWVMPVRQLQYWF